MGFEIFRMMGTIALNREEALKDIRIIKQEAQRASTEMGRSFAKFTTEHSAQFKKVGMVAAAAGAVISLAIKKVRGSFDEYESALVDMGKITEESLESIEARMKKLPPVLGSLTELTRGYYQIVSAGIKEPVEAINTLTVAAQTAAAAHMNQSEVVKGLTKVMAGYEGQIENVSEAADLMFAIEKEGQTTVGELIPIIGSLATMSAQLKISQDEMGASMAVITKTAGSTAEAATELEGVLTGLMKPTDAMKDAIEGMGFATAELAIEELGFVEVLRRLDEVTGGNSEAMGELFGRKQAILGISKLTSEEMKILTDTIASVAEKAGMADEAYKHWLTTGEALNKETKATTENLLILIGDAIDPMMDRLQERMTETITMMGEWIEKNEELAASIFQWGGGLGMVLIPFAALMMMLPGLVIAVPKVIGFVYALAFAMGTTVPGLLLFVGAITLISKALFGWIDAIKEGQRIKEMETKSAESYSEALEKLKKAYNLTDEELQYFIDNHKMVPRILNESRRVMMLTEADTRAMTAATKDYVETVEDEIKVVKEAAKSFEEMDSAISKSLILGKELSEQQEDYMVLRQRMSDVDKTATQMKIDDLDRECLALFTNMKTNLMTMEQIDEYRQVMLSHIIAESSEREEHLSNMEQIETKLFELTHSQTEVKIRDLELERDARIDMAKQARLSAAEEADDIEEIIELFNKKKASVLELANARKVELQGLKLINAQLALVEIQHKDTGDYADYQREKTALLEQQYDLLNQALSETEFRSAEWFELTMAMESNRNKLEEVTGAQSAMDRGMEKIADRLFELTHTSLEVAIRKLDKQKQSYLDLGYAQEKVNEWYAEEIKNLDELNKKKDEGIDKNKELIKSYKPFGPKRGPFSGLIRIGGRLAPELLYGPLEPEGLMARGGPVRAFINAAKFLAGGGSTDTVPIMATPGEYLIKKEYVDFVRRTGMVTGGLVEAIQKGLPTPSPAFAGGGMVRGSSRGMEGVGARLGGWVYSPTININNPIVRSDEDLVEMKELVNEVLEENAGDLDTSGNEVGV